MSSSVIASILAQSTLTRASRADLLKGFAMAAHLPSVGLSQRDHTTLSIPVHVNAHEHAPQDMTERYHARLAIFEAVVPDGFVRPGEKMLGQRKRHPMLRPIDGILRRVEHILQVALIRLWRSLGQGARRHRSSDTAALSEHLGREAAPAWRGLRSTARPTRSRPNRR